MQVPFTIFAIWAVGSAMGNGYEDEDAYSHTPAHYQFEYGVASPITGDVKAQREHRQGHLVNGEYALRESDGTTRLVQYKSSPQAGFEAIVQRAGVAVHPAIGNQGLGGGQGYGGHQGFAGQGFGGKAYGGHVYGGHAYSGYKYGGRELGGQELGLHGFGGQGFGGQGFGGQGFGGLLGALGNSYVGTTAWGNQGSEHGHGLGHRHGKGHGY